MHNAVSTVKVVFFSNLYEMGVKMLLCQLDLSDLNKSDVVIMTCQPLNMNKRTLTNVLIYAWHLYIYCFPKCAVKGVIMITLMTHSLIRLSKLRTYWIKLGL